MNNVALKIDLFNGKDLFKSLANYNMAIANIAYTANYSDANDYKVGEGGASFWFDPSQIRTTPTSRYYPLGHPVQLDTRLCLVLHVANYVSLLIINTLYANTKDVLIEDMCCGMGNLVFYLSKLGFTNFSMVDNFTQIPYSMFDETMRLIARSTPTFQCSVNDSTSSPKIINLVSYTSFLRSVIPDSADLLMFSVPIMPGMGNLEINDWMFYQEYCLLAYDANQFMWIYCTKDKYQEFAEKLGPLKVQ